LPVAPGRIASSGAEMKMCSISVAPMPSISFSPVAACQASKVAFGRASPAETHFSRERQSWSPSSGIMAR
jgi:hypothetical protein